MKISQKEMEENFVKSSKVTYETNSKITTQINACDYFRLFFENLHMCKESSFYENQKMEMKGFAYRED